MLKPKTTATRELISLDGLWRFDVGSPEAQSPWLEPLPSDLEAPVPASYNDLFVDHSIREHVGWAWYQRRIRIPRGWDGQRITIRFGSVTHSAKVFLDGDIVAEHVGGYTPFEADVTALVEAGGEYRLTVGVDNRLTNATIPPGKVTERPDGRLAQSYLHDFFNYAGIARSVQLVSTPEVFISDVTVTTERDGSTGLISYHVVAERVASETVRVLLRDQDGVEVASGAGAEGILHVADVRLWRPGAAYLYDLEVRIERDGALVDSYDLPVGVRTVEVRGAEFLINGEPFYFTGFGKHEDTPVRGKGHDDAYLVHDVELMKWTGANSFRTSHYPYAEEVLEYADRHGIVVIDETAAVGINMLIRAGISGGVTRTFGPEAIGDESQAALLAHVRELIARDKNHPSVVMWSLTNEPASDEDGAREYFEPIVKLARELDPTRPLTYSVVAFATTENDKIADLFDVISLNRYYGWYIATGDLDAAEPMLENELRAWADKYGKPMIMSEYGADTAAGTHSLFETPWSEEFQVAYFAMYHRVFDRVPELVGEQVWNFADFRTTAGIHRVDGNRKGIFTRDRRPKAAAHELRKRWTRIGSRKPGAQG